MKLARRCLILGIVSFSAACTKGTPDFEISDGNRVPQPKFSGATVKNLQTFNDAVTFQINGECDSKIQGIKGSAVGTATTFTNLTSLTVSGVNVTCSTDNKFSFVLKSLSALGYAATEGTVYEIQLRAETAAGLSKPSYIRILFTAAAGGTPPIIISSGGTGGNLVKDLGNTVSAQVRINNKMNERATASTQAGGSEAFLKSGPGGIGAHIGVRTHH